MEDILLDTDVIIEYLRTKDKSKTLLIDLLKKYNLFLSPITEFELLYLIILYASLPGFMIIPSSSYTEIHEFNIYTR